MLNFFFILTLIIPLFFWIPMIFAPRRKFTLNFFNTSYSYAGFLLLGGLYIFTIVGATLDGISRGAFNLGNFTSPAGLAVFMSSPAVALVVWLHMTVMDLAGGFYIYKEADRLDMPIRMTQVVLFMTFLLGPLGMFWFGLWRVLIGMRRTAEAKALIKQQEQQLA